ncbi:MAG TPA: PorP/SprF family type IX secretion system membrane protein [Cyclobacteriaceae bacterium]|nr:PorP/SprF family type IX secretion system membrane protein [Cyclobacteriaceae bacterium]
MYTKGCLLVAFVAISSWSRGQYFQYTQYNFTTQRINPAMTGLTRYASVGTSYRHQQTAGDFSINSNFVNLSYPLLNASTGVPWSGIALSLHNDQSAGIFKTQEAALGYAIHVRLSRYQAFSFGARALYQSRKIGLDGFYTGSQYVADRGFDLGRSSGEDFSEIRNSFKTFSAGLYWQEVDKKGRVMHHFGASLFDINKPSDSFFGSTTRLPSTFVMNAGFQAYSGGFNAYPEGLFTLSGGAMMLNGGVRLQKELNVSPKKQSDLVDVIVKYAVGRSGIVGFQLHLEKISVGISYDFPFFRKNPGNLGALEFGLELRRLVSTRAQKIVARRQKERAELAKTQVPKKEIPPVDSVKADTAPVVIVETQKPKEEIKDVTPSANAGKIKQEPMIIEHVTLHFAFDFNSSDLDEPTESFLDQLAEQLKQDENLQLTIEGHTDNVGSDKFNLRLSQKRADVVKTLLIKKGINPERLHTEGKGMREPLNNNETAEDQAKNRRVEITVYY